MKKILRDYYFLVLLVLIVGFFGKSVFAAEMKVHYRCITDKAVTYETAEGHLFSGRELTYSPESGNSLNLSVGRFPMQYQFWIRKPYGQNKRFVSVFQGSTMLKETIDLGEEGQSSETTFPFQLNDGDDIINGKCKIKVD